MIQTIFKPCLWSEIRKEQRAGKAGDVSVGVDFWKNASRFELAVAIMLSVNIFFQ
jgi:hypothetical protein